MRPACSVEEGVSSRSSMKSDAVRSGVNNSHEAEQQHLQRNNSSTNANYNDVDDDEG
jgi:hypothetical protein